MIDGKDSLAPQLFWVCVSWCSLFYSLKKLSSKYNKLRTIHSVLPGLRISLKQDREKGLTLSHSQLLVWLQSLAIPNLTHAPATNTPPGSLLEMQSLRPHPSPTESESALHESLGDSCAFWDAHAHLRRWWHVQYDMSCNG
jgi:hypothetical protein